MALSPHSYQDACVRAFHDDLSNRILVFDGAMGTNIQTQGLTIDDFGGLEGCGEALNLHCPQAVRKVHADFLRAGCRAVETCTFGATRIVMREYGLENRIGEINRAAVRIAREAMEEVPGAGPRYIAGSLGPTSKLPSLGQIGFDEMAAAYLEQVESLWDAGADLFVVETCQDLLQTRAALFALASHFRKMGSRRPVMVSVTLEAAGTMLLGSDITAVTTILEPFDMIDVVGINCATGPLEMVRHVEYLSTQWNKRISVMPNAGLPENVGGKPVYRLTPAELAAFHERFVRENGINIAGGCCGTTPAHLEAVVKAVGNLKPVHRLVRRIPSASSLYQAVSLTQEPPPCLIGERTNANGSRAFRDLLLKADWDGMTAVGREQARGGAHLLDVSVAYVGRDESRDMEKLVSIFATQVKLPLLIDSTDPKVVESALKRHAGRCIINSVNFEAGEAKVREMAAVARDYGAALICLTIDEDGMAKTFGRKMAIAKRLHNLLVDECGLRSSDLIFDTLTFTLGSGDAELRTAAVQTLEAVAGIREQFPASHTLLGVSNISFGLNPGAREVLNSVFLDEAVKRGLHMAIVNPRGIQPIFKISSDKRRLAVDLLYNAHGDGSDLSAFIGAFEGGKPAAKRDEAMLTPESALRLKILDGEKAGLEDIINRLLTAGQPPLAVVNDILIPSMQEVGQLFGAGQMQLPFVLQSAEVMKAAVNILEPHMEKREIDPRRRIILATVRGDVHDIGKNLVNILLSNNGFAVTDLGIKIDIDTMIRAVIRQNANVIGMSGLLVKSTQIMKENLEELNRRGLTPHVVLGGAALTRAFVEEDLAKLYKGRVFFAPDAFAGLLLMQRLSDEKTETAESESVKAKDGTSVTKGEPPSGDSGGIVTFEHQACVSESIDSKSGDEADRKKSSGLEASGGFARSFPPAGHIPIPPFKGCRILELPLDEVIPHIDRDSLFRFRWQYKKGHLDETAWKRILQDEIEPSFQELIKRVKSEKLVAISATYGFFRVRAEGNSLLVTRSDSSEPIRWKFPRQTRTPGLCLSDYFAEDREDTIGLWATTVGSRIIEEGHRLYETGHYRDYLHLHGLAVELAESSAAWVEEKMLQDLGLAKGLRFSFGYPSCPDLEYQKELLKLLEAERIGISLTELNQMVPEASLSGIFVHHPEARYFIP
ncbi:MAG: methionine synthase [Candidatus Riflebacteria bacterium]|nr:methionine synthase [Candidatus Riflebacteria bacterium]